MSGQQATLGTFDVEREPELQDAHDTREVDASAWDPMVVLTDDGEPERYDPSECLNCGAYVARGIRQLFGVAPGAAMDGCPTCKPKRWLDNGGPAPGNDVKGAVEERWE